MSGGTGVVGAFLEGSLTITGQLVVLWLRNRKARTLDEARTKLLQHMLDGRDWRKLPTFSRVIGADAEITRRLAIELGARSGREAQAARWLGWWCRRINRLAWSASDA
jgi:hypothetical protein